MTLHRRPVVAPFNPLPRTIPGVRLVQRGAHVSLRTDVTCWMVWRRPTTRMGRRNTRPRGSAADGQGRKPSGARMAERSGVGRMTLETTPAPGFTIGATVASGWNLPGTPILSHVTCRPATSAAVSPTGRPTIGMPMGPGGRVTALPTAHWPDRCPRLLYSLDQLHTLCGKIR